MLFLYSVGPANDSNLTHQCINPSDCFFFNLWSILVRCARIPLWHVLKGCRCVAWMSVRGLLCSGLNASILLAVVYGVIVDKVTYWVYGTAHFIGRAEETRGVCLTHRCSPAMCVTLRQWHAELDFAERVSWVNEPKGRLLRHTIWHKPIDRHTYTNTWACTEKQTLLPLFSNLSQSFVPFFLSQSAVFYQCLLMH